MPTQPLAKASGAHTGSSVVVKTDVKASSSDSWNRYYSPTRGSWFLYNHSTNEVALGIYQSVGVSCINVALFINADFLGSHKARWALVRSLILHDQDNLER